MSEEKDSLAAVVEEGERLKQIASQEGLKVWYSEEDAGYIAIRESLPSISGYGETEAQALTYLAAAATLGIEALNDDALSLRQSLADAEKERDESEELRRSLAEALSEALDDVEGLQSRLGKAESALLSSRADAINEAREALQAMVRAFSGYDLPGDRHNALMLARALLLPEQTTPSQSSAATTEPK